MDGGANVVEYLTCGFAGEIKFADAGTDTRKFAGMGAVFKNVDSYGDVIEPGAFAAWLSDVKNGKQDWPAMLSQHGGWGMTAEDLTPVGAWLDLYEDGKGLGVEGELADTPRGGELYTLMKMKPRPAIKGLSIGYFAREFDMGSKPDEPRRRLKRVDVVEISPVTFPANGKAKISSVKSGNLTEREIERWLTRDAGLSRSEAVHVINHGFKSLLATRDAGRGESQELTELAEMLRANTAVLAA